MNALDHRVKRVLTAEADQLTPSGELARTAIRRGGRIRRGRRAAGIGIAATGVVLAVFLPTTILNSTAPDPAASPSPMPSAAMVVHAAKPPAGWSWPGDKAFDAWLAKLPQGDLPQVPYLQAGYLNDGNQRVALPALARRDATTYSIGRVADGWLIGIQSWGGKEPGGFGLLKRSGQFEFLAKGDPRGAVLSPDGKRLAYGIGPWDGKHKTEVKPEDTAKEMTRVAVMDLATKKQTSSTSVLEGRLRGWNAMGIWMTMSATGPGGRWQSANWVPGSGKPFSVVAADVAVTSSRSPRMLWLTGDCERVVALTKDHSAPAEYCGFGSAGGTSGLLSPDGNVYVRRDGVAMAVGSRQETRLDLLSGVPIHDHAWEDSSHVLISAGIPGKAALIRCDVQSGRCERTTNTPANHISYGPNN